MYESESEGRILRQIELARTKEPTCDLEGFLAENQEITFDQHVGSSARRYISASEVRGAVRVSASAQPPPRYIVEVEVNCDECGGSGFDSGGLDPWGPEPCPLCHGAKTQRTTRNFLAEAFQIAANLESARPVERQHLVAVIQHCREAVSALVSLPEVAKPRSDLREAARSHSARHSQMKRRKRHVTFSSQRT